jgi:hypothetical protein
MKQLTTIQNVIDEAQKLQLYEQLIIQLNKDLVSANTELQFPTNTNPDNLTSGLANFLTELIQHRFSDYLNLLYVVDVSEREAKQITSTNLEDVTLKITFLILKREWKKVWYKNKY